MKPAEPKKSAKKVAAPKTDTSLQETATNRRYLIIMGLVIAAIVLVSGYVGYKLTTTYIRQANEIKAQDLLITALVQKQQNLDALKPNFEAITAKGVGGVSDADLILRALPLDQNYKDLVAMLEKIAQESGIKVTSVTQTAASGGSSTTGDSQTTAGAGSAPQKYQFTVGLEGSYAGILDFLKKTEQSSRVMNFSVMNLTGGTSNNIQANTTFETFFQGPANVNSTERPL